MDPLQPSVLAVVFGSLFVTWKASSLRVKLKAAAFLTVSASLYSLWYAPTILADAHILDAGLIQTSLLVRDTFVSLIETTNAGRIWLILLGLNLLISFTGTRLKFLYHMRAILVVLFWLASGYMVYRIFVEAEGSLATLLPMLMPLALSIAARAQETLHSF